MINKTICRAVTPRASATTLAGGSDPLLKAKEQFGIHNHEYYRNILKGIKEHFSQGFYNIFPTTSSKFPFPYKGCSGSQSLRCGSGTFTSRRMSGDLGPHVAAGGRAVQVQHYIKQGDGFEFSNFNALRIYRMLPIQLDACKNIKSEPLPLKHVACK